MSDHVTPLPRSHGEGGQVLAGAQALPWLRCLELINL